MLWVLAGCIFVLKLVDKDKSDYQSTTCLDQIIPELIFEV